MESYFRYNKESGAIMVDCSDITNGGDVEYPLVYVDNSDDAENVCDALNAIMTILDNSIGK